MRKGLIYKTAVFVIALLILLTYIPSVTISGRSNYVYSQKRDKKDNNPLNNTLLRRTWMRYRLA